MTTIYNVYETEDSGPQYVRRDDLEDALDDRERLILALINSQWHEIVWLRGLLGVTGAALLLVTLAVALT